MGGRGLVLGMLNTFPVSTGWWICVLWFHAMWFLLQHPILLRLFSPLVAKVRQAYVPFPPFALAKGQFLLKQKRSNFLDLRNSVEVLGNLKCLSASENLTLSSASSGSCCAGPAMDVSRQPLKGEENFPSSWKGAGRCGCIHPYWSEHHLLVQFN